MSNCYELMRREYGMSDSEFWHELSLAKMMRILQVRGQRFEQQMPDNDAARQIAALDAAGL